MTLQKLEQAITAICEVLRTVDSVRQVYEYPPDSVNAWPAVVIFAQSGTYDAAPQGSRKALHNIVIELAMPQQKATTARQMETLTPFVDTIPAALLAEVSDGGGQFSNTISTFERVQYAFFLSDYSGAPVRGYRFTMQNVKILE